MDQETTNELLVHCLRGKIDALRLEQLADSDWHDLMQQAGRLAVRSLLYQCLKRQHLDSHIPAGLLEKVRKGYLGCAWKNSRLYDDLSGVLKALQQNNIPVIVLKGACLAQNVYGNIALRPMDDIDILVRKSDLQRAKEKLLDLGYSSFREEDVKAVSSREHHLSPFFKQGAAPVELHWNLESPIYPFTIDPEGLWQRAQPIRIAGVEAHTLSPDDLLLHLCLHTSFGHLYYHGLRACCDIRETIRRYRDELDWETVQARACQWGAANSVYLTLYLTKILLGADIPDDFLDRNRPKSYTPQLLAEAKELIFEEPEKCASRNPHVLKLFASKFSLATLGLLLQRIFLPPEKMAELYSIPLDSLRILLYYPVRLKDLLVRHVRRVWRKDEATAQQLRLIDWLSSG